MFVGMTYKEVYEEKNTLFRIEIWGTKGFNFIKNVPQSV